MIKADPNLKYTDLLEPLHEMWRLSGIKIEALQNRWNPKYGPPVVTRAGKYTSRTWTSWTEGFVYGSALLQFDATSDQKFLELGRRLTFERMPNHLTDRGVHDHGFNNVSTYGNLWRMTGEGNSVSHGDREVCELALRVSGAVQAMRWTNTDRGHGFIHSFNGPQSLFVDTIRSLRSLAISHKLGHVFIGEQVQHISLLERLVHHALVTAQFSVYYGKGRDVYDVRGRTAHEILFNPTNGTYRAPSTQQGYSPFSTWTRGLAWAILGFAEQLEFLTTLDEDEFTLIGDKSDIISELLAAAIATADFYCEHSPTDGIPYWDTGAPGLAQLGEWRNRPAEPFNDHEPIDSSAAAIAAQGLIRMAQYLDKSDPAASNKYLQAGLTTTKTLLGPTYLSCDAKHEGLLLHTVYHRPNGWDYVPEGRTIPCGESCMWGDYHLQELGLLVQRLATEKKYPTFFGG